MTSKFKYQFTKKGLSSTGASPLDPITAWGLPPSGPLPTAVARGLGPGTDIGLRSQFDLEEHLM